MDFLARLRLHISTPISSRLSSTFSLDRLHFLEGLVRPAKKSSFALEMADLDWTSGRVFDQDSNVVKDTVEYRREKRGRDVEEKEKLLSKSFGGCRCRV